MELIKLHIKKSFPVKYTLLLQNLIQSLCILKELSSSKLIEIAAFPRVRRIRNTDAALVFDPPPLQGSSQTLLPPPAHPRVSPPSVSVRASSCKRKVTYWEKLQHNTPSHFPVRAKLSVNLADRN